MPRQLGVLMVVLLCAIPAAWSEEPASDNALLYYNRSIAYYQKREYDRAIADATKAIEINPGYAEAYNSRAKAHHGKGIYDRTIADTSKAIEISPGLY